MLIFFVNFLTIICLNSLKTLNYSLLINTWLFFTESTVADLLGLGNRSNYTGKSVCFIFSILQILCIFYCMLLKGISPNSFRFKYQ